MQGKQPKNYELRVGYFDKELMTCTMSKRLICNVVAKQRQVTWTEKEDAGGGYYVAGPGIKMKGEVTDYLVYDGESYIGEIVSGSSINFLDDHNHHVKVPLANLHLLKPKTTTE